MLIGQLYGVPHGILRVFITVLDENPLILSQSNLFYKKNRPPQKKICRHILNCLRKLFIKKQFRLLPAVGEIVFL
jgi:hypothetical protein